MLCRPDDGTPIIIALFLCRFRSLSGARVVAISFICGLISWILYRSFIYPFFQSPLRHIPTVPSIPLWGHLFQIINSEVGVPQRNWHRKYGPVVRYFFPLGGERLSIADDDAIKEITVRDCYGYAKPVRVQKWMASVLGRGVLLVDGNEHMKQRKALAPAFSISSIRALAPVFWRKGLLMTTLLGRKHFAHHAQTIASIEMLDWMNRATLDVICEAGFGYELSSLEHPTTALRQAYASVFAFDFWSRLTQGLLQQSQIFRIIPSQMNRSMASASRVIRSTTDEIVTNKLHADNKEARDIISLVVHANKNIDDEGESYLSFENIRDQVMTFLGAGHDTTAAAVVWTLHLLSKNQHIQDRLRQEIQKALPSVVDSLEAHTLLPQIDVDQLPYLSNVCRESLRYIPPIPLTIREALHDTTLANHPIPKGTKLYIMANAINRLPEYWGPDADTFDPDRWDKLPSTHATNSFMTFLHGPRSCIGRKFAEMEMKVFLCCLLSTYKFEPDSAFEDQEDWKMWRLVLRPRDGINLKVSMI
ncbi:cytochrome P450 [Viridothelium virens]|uniref:Cytochrome P450 n=1 Tax=Viridothelium virens TaxID=1048519 RepID=A0A6A6GUB0_VIRVR|nr:cytochrome P450 [Viridothelium virens]